MSWGLSGHYIPINHLAHFAKTRRNPCRMIDSEKARIGEDDVNETER